MLRWVIIIPSLGVTRRPPKYCYPDPRAGLSCQTASLSITVTDWADTERLAPTWPRVSPLLMLD